MSNPNQPSTISNLKLFIPLLAVATGTGIEVVYGPGYAPLWLSLIAVLLGCGLPVWIGLPLCLGSLWALVPAPGDFRKWILP